MGRKNIAGILMAGLMFLALTGCGVSGRETVPKQGETVLKETETESVQMAEYAVILQTDEDDFWTEIQASIEEQAKVLGIDVDIYMAQSTKDEEGQLAILDSCIEKGYKGIGIAPISKDNLTAGIGEATERGIPIVDIGTAVDLEALTEVSGAIAAYVATDQEAVGAEGAEYIVDNIEEGSKVVILEDKENSTDGQDRSKGAIQTLEKAGMDVVSDISAEGDQQKAMELTTELIQKKPDLQAIYCCSDAMALGALQAVTNSDLLGEIMVVGADGTAEAIKSVQEGKLSATVAEDGTTIGSKALELLIGAAQSEYVGNTGEMPEVTAVPGKLIIKE